MDFYQATFSDIQGNEFKVVLSKTQPTTTGVDNIVTMSGNPLQIRSMGGGKGTENIVIGSEAVFEVLTRKTDIGTPEQSVAFYDDLFNSSYGDWYMAVFYGSTLRWVGYVQPDNLSRTFIDEAIIISISATDGLKDLSQNRPLLRVPPLFKENVFTLIKVCLATVGIELDFTVKSDLDSDYGGFVDTYVDLRRFITSKDGFSQPDTALEIIEKILVPFNMTLRQSNGRYYIMSSGEQGGLGKRYTWGLTYVDVEIINAVNIDAYKFVRGGDYSKRSPVKTLDITHRNRNLGASISTDDFNDYVTGPWTIGFNTQAVVDGDLRIQTDEGQTETRVMAFTTPVEVTPITDNDYLRVSFEHEITQEDNIRDQVTIPNFRIKITKGDVVIQDFISYMYEQSQQFTSPINNTFKITDTTDINVSIEFFFEASNEGLTPADPEYNEYFVEFFLRNFDITLVTVIDDEIVDDVTFDRIFRATNPDGKEVVEKELFVADGLNLGDIGAFYGLDAAFELVTSWNRGAASRSLVSWLASDYITLRQRYTNYIDLTLYDTSNAIFPKDIIQFDGVLYRVINYDKQFKPNRLRLFVLELPTNVVHPDISIIQLTSMDGEGTRPGSVTVPAAVQLRHDMDDPAYHRPSSEADYGKPVRANPDTGAIEFESIGSEYVSMETDSTPFALKHWYDYTQSAGRLYGGKITNNLDGTVHIAPGAGIIKSMPGSPADGEDCELSTCPSISENIFITWAEVAALALTDNAYNYIYYEGSTGTIKTTTNFYTVNFTQDFTIGRAYRTGTNVVVRLCGTNLWNFNRRVQLFGEERFPVERARGLMIGYSGRNISLTEGILWAELVNRFVIEAFNSSVTPFTYWYNDGAWQSVSANLISNTQYNNFGVGLANLVGSRYATHWVYAVHDSTIHVVYGRESHSNLASALNEPIPTSLPGLLSAYATFVGRVIIQNGQDILQADSPFIESFAVAGVTDHNDLANIGEDDHHNRLHSMTSELDHKTEIEQAGKITGWGTSGEPAAYDKEVYGKVVIPLQPDSDEYYLSGGLTWVKRHVHQEAAPDVNLFIIGSTWTRPSTGVKYELFQSGETKFWIDISDPKL